MHTGTLHRLAALAALGGFPLTACTPLEPSRPGAPGPFSDGARAASTMHSATAATTGESLATGASTGRLASATTFIIAKHQATQRQRQVAIQRARAVQKKLVEREARATTTTPTTAKKKQAPKKKLPRYIAVETVREPTTAPQAKKVVMIWDTQAQDIVGNNVYDISNPPPVGATTRFETYAAEYVGAGL